MSKDLVGYLFDALEREEEEALERRIERDGKLRAEVDGLRKLTRPLADDDRIQSPAGLAERTLAYVKGATESAAWRSLEAGSETRARWRALDCCVAAGVVAVAAALLVPAMSAVREQQTRIGCADRLRQLGVALALYSDQESSQLPFVSASGPMSHAGIFAVLLKSQELIEGGGSLICPGAESAVVLLPDKEGYLQALRDPPRAQLLRRYMAGSYGYVLGFQDQGAHHGYQLRSDSQPVVSDRPARSEEPGYACSPNHADRGLNLLFAGGNVRWLSAPVYGGDELFSNRRGEVGAGLGPLDTVIGVSEATPYPPTEL